MCDDCIRVASHHLFIPGSISTGIPNAAEFCTSWKQHQLWMGGTHRKPGCLLHSDKGVWMGERKIIKGNVGGERGRGRERARENGREGEIGSRRVGPACVWGEVATRHRDISVAVSRHGARPHTALHNAAVSPPIHTRSQR